VCPTPSVTQHDTFAQACSPQVNAATIEGVSTQLRGSAGGANVDAAHAQVATGEEQLRRAQECNGASFTGPMDWTVGLFAVRRVMHE
jgi:hypothetical protein